MREGHSAAFGHGQILLSFLLLLKSRREQKHEGLSATDAQGASQEDETLDTNDVSFLAVSAAKRGRLRRSP